MIFSFVEFRDIVAMTLIVGYIFMDIFHRASGGYALSHAFDWKAFRIACLVTAPAIILHELGHKFVALSFGYSAVFHAAYTFLAIGVLLKLMRTGFIFFVPAFVAISCSSASCSMDPLSMAIIAAAGPFVNLALFGVSYSVLKYSKHLSRDARVAWHITKVINLFLFIFNMLPIPGFDGSKVFSGLHQAFF